MSEQGLQRSVEATREPSFLLAKPEKRLLRWIAARWARWVLPDDLTALGVLAAIGLGLGLSPLMSLSIGTLIVLWLGRAARNLRELARKEPSAPRR